MILRFPGLVRISQKFWAEDAAKDSRCANSVSRLEYGIEKISAIDTYVAHVALELNHDGGIFFSPTIVLERVVRGALHLSASAKLTG